MSIKKNNTYFQEDNGKVYYYDENGERKNVPNSALGTLKDDLESTSAVLIDTIETTSDILHNEIETASGNLQEQIDNIGSPLTYSGLSSVAEINAITSTKQGTVYTISDSGTITGLNSDIQVNKSDEIAYAENQGWVKIGKDFLYSDYYKKTETSGKEEIQDALDLKQNTLTAGTDLVINNGVISVNTNGSAIGDFAFVEGENTFAGGLCDHVEGMGGIANQGGLTHIEGFQYHQYDSNVASNYAGKNVVQFYHSSTFSNKDTTIHGQKYEFVKAFKDKFIVVCDYNNNKDEFHYTTSTFFKPLIFNILDVSLDEDQNYFDVTIDGYIPEEVSTVGGGIYLLGPTSLNYLCGDGGSLEELSGKILNTFACSYFGFPGNKNNVIDKYTFIYVSGGYSLLDETTVSFNKILKVNKIEYNETTNRYIITTEDGIEIPEILSGGYSFSLYSIYSIDYGCNHIEGFDNIIRDGAYSHAEGYWNVITNSKAHAEGYNNKVNGAAAHAEGELNTARGTDSHAEGYNTSACGSCSHTEGYGTSIYTNASYAHAEGYQTKVSGQAAHAEGSATIASGDASHAEGVSSIANDCCSHSEGYQTNANGYCSHSEGYQTNANGQQSHTEGFGTIAGGYNSHAEGNQTKATDSQAHAEGWETLASNQNTHAEGCKTSATGDTSHTEGYKTIASNSYTHAEGYETSACGYGSHAEGLSSYANGNYSHTEGQQTSALGNYSHAAGNSAVANGQCSFAYGEDVSAKGSYSVAFGYKTLANGWNSFAECYYNSAISDNSHAEGSYTIASGKASHAEGSGTIAGSDYMHVGGSYNKTSSDALFVIGNGSNDLNRSDAFIVSADGTVSARRFIESEPSYTLTGGNNIVVTENAGINKVIIDLDTDASTVISELSTLLNNKPTTGKYIIGCENGTLSWVEVETNG